MLVLALFAQQLLPSGLDSVLDNPALRGTSISICVEQLDGNMIFDRTCERRLIPASNEKLFTAAFAFNQLGMEYHPSTRFWKLPDRVVVETTGDPMLTYADLKHAKDVLHLTGKDPVYVKEPYRIGYPPQWSVEDLPNKYAAPVTAFTVDRGSFEVCADNGKAVCEPEQYDLKLECEKGGRCHVKYDPFARTVKVYGKIPEKKEVLDTLSLPDPDRAAASVLGDHFIETDATPSTPPDLTLEGPLLPAIVKECLSESDNNLAENLLMLGALHDGTLGEDPYPTATDREREFLVKTVGLDSDEIHISDGSGLSRYNWVSSHSIAKLLQWEAAQPTFDLWKQSLASPGVGTLKHRLKDSSFVGKTGTMKGITALSGYVNTANGKPVIVSMLFNNHTCPNSKIREIEDQFIRKIEGITLSGTVLDDALDRESAVTLPSPGPLPSNWLYGLGGDGSAPLPWSDR